MSRWGLIDNTLEGRQKIWFPHFFNGLVPLQPEANRLWRQKIFFTTDPKERKMIRKMCAEDLLFFTAGFVSIYDAGDESGVPGPVPFIPYEFQVESFTAMWSCMHVDRCPLRGKKPRKIGFTWMALDILNHCWQFMPNRTLLIGSHREEEVDGAASSSKGGAFVGDWSLLFPKIDYMHIHQPRWLLPEGYKPRTEPYRTRMRIMNPENGSLFRGTSASSSAAHGERGWAAFWDEAALTENLYDIIAGLSEYSP